MVVGVGGDSCVGKSTFVTSIEKIVGTENMTCLNGDDAHKWERGDPQWRTLTHLNPKANFVHKDMEHMLSLLRGETIERKSYDHTKGMFLLPERVEPKGLIVFQGLLPFVLEEMRRLYDVKIYIEADDTSRITWKLKRDVEHRGYTRETVRSEIDKRKSDAEKYIYPQREFADWVVQYSSTTDGEMKMEHIMKNSVAIDDIVTELATYNTLAVQHHYSDMHTQRVSLVGDIQKEAIASIAYSLFPGLHDLLGHEQPVFEGGMRGVNQLLYIAVLNNHYTTRYERIS